MRANTDWFRDAKWGVFMHYVNTPEESAVHETIFVESALLARRREG